MTALLATLTEGTLRIYARHDDDDRLDQVGQLRTPLDHDGALRLMSDLDRLNGWTRNGAVAAVGRGGGGAAPVPAAALPAPKPRHAGRRQRRRDYTPLIDAVAAVPGGLTFGEMAGVLGIDSTHGGLKARVDQWLRDGVLVRDATGERPGAGRAQFRYRLATVDAPLPRPVRRDRAGAGRRREVLLAAAREAGSIRSGDARRLYPDVNDASLHGDLARLVRDGALVRTGDPGIGGGARGGYVWRPVES